MLLTGLFDVRSILVHRAFHVVQVVLGLLAAVGIVFGLGTGRVVPALLAVRLLLFAGFFSLSLRLRLLVLTGPSPAARSWGGAVAQLVGRIENLGHFAVEGFSLFFLSLDQCGNLLFRTKLGLQNLLNAARVAQ